MSTDLLTWLNTLDSLALDGLMENLPIFADWLEEYGHPASPLLRSLKILPCEMNKTCTAKFYHGHGKDEFLYAGDLLVNKQSYIQSFFGRQGSQQSSEQFIHCSILRPAFRNRCRECDSGKQDSDDCSLCSGRGWHPSMDMPVPVLTEWKPRLLPENEMTGGFPVPEQYVGELLHFMESGETLFGGPMPSLDTLLFGDENSAKPQGVINIEPNASFNFGPNVSTFHMVGKKGVVLSADFKSFVGDLKPKTEDKSVATPVKVKWNAKPLSMPPGGSPYVVLKDDDK